MKVPKPDSLATTFGRRARRAMPARQRSRPSSVVSSSMPACWRTKVRRRARIGEVAGALHLAGKDLEVEAQPVVREARDVALQRGVAAEVPAGGEAVERVLVPVELLANSAKTWKSRQPVERRARVRRGHVRKGDGPVRPAGLGGEALIQAASPSARSRPGHCRARRNLVSISREFTRWRVGDIAQVLTDRVSLGGIASLARKIARGAQRPRTAHGRSAGARSRWKWLSTDRSSSEPL